MEIVNYLKYKGYLVLLLIVNFVYWMDIFNGIYDEIFFIFYWYLVVCCGVGFFGFFGNVFIKSNGVVVILGFVVIVVEFILIELIFVEENYCDDCWLCEVVCVFGFING